MTALACLLLAAARADAAPTCQIANATPMTFGTYHAGQAGPLDSVGEIDVTCAGAASIQVILGRGISGRESPRELTGGGVSIAYNLFLDAARTTIWGDGAEGTQTFMGAVMAAQTLRLPVFGRIFALQAGAPRGTYTDRIVVSVIF